MASTLKMEYQVFLCIFQNNSAMAKFVWKMQKNAGIMKSMVDAMPLFLLDDLLRGFWRYEIFVFWAV